MVTEMLRLLLGCVVKENPDQVIWVLPSASAVITSAWDPAVVPSLKVAEPGVYMKPFGR